MTDYEGGFAAQDVDEVRAAIDRVDISAQRMSRTLTRAFSSAVVGGKSLEDTLKGVALSLSKVALDAAMKPLQQGLSSAIGSTLSSLSGQGGAAVPVTAFADGGVVARPTFFGSGGGLGLMGERGAEAIMPLARGPDGRLGVASNGAGARAPVVNVTINTPDAESFRRSQVQVSAALARAVMRGHRGV
ncbi:MAG: phage tail tape measure protein [Beijerinckiaceae bacterium]|nr:phage tail tape measure protein [Beijerinckiaceae bacterium]